MTCRNFDIGPVGRTACWGAVLSALICGCQQTPNPNPAQTAQSPSPFEKRRSSTVPTNDTKTSPSDRSRLVDPPPAGFKPTVGKNKVSLNLRLEKKILRRGEAPRFRIELTNISPKDIWFIEEGVSFFRTCIISVAQQFLVIRITQPDGKDVVASSPIAMGDSLQMDEIHFPPSWTDAQKREWATHRDEEYRSTHELNIPIHPGETLHTLGDGPSDLYCTLRTSLHLDSPGTYVVRAIFDDTPPPLNETRIRALEKHGFSRKEQLEERERAIAAARGRTTSEQITFEVAP